MKTYYGVKTTFYDNGHISASRLVKKAERKPEDTEDCFENFDQYTDWFDTKAESEMFLAKAKKEAV
jgi:hypothetical protein